MLSEIIKLKEKNNQTSKTTLSQTKTNQIIVETESCGKTHLNAGWRYLLQINSMAIEIVSINIKFPNPSRSIMTLNHCSREMTSLAHFSKEIFTGSLSTKILTEYARSISFQMPSVIPTRINTLYTEMLLKEVNIHLQYVS